MNHKNKPIKTVWNFVNGNSPNAKLVIIICFFEILFSVKKR